MHRAASTTAAALVVLASLTPLTGCVPFAGCGDGNLEPFVGTWELHRTLDDSSPCPDFQIPASANVGIERDAVDGFLIDSPDLVGAVTYEEPTEGAYGTLRFSLSESWWSSEGSAAAIVDYELTDDGYALMGVAHTRFYWDTDAAGTECTYDWSVHSI